MLSRLGQPAVRIHPNRSKVRTGNFARISGDKKNPVAERKSRKQIYDCTRIRRNPMPDSSRIRFIAFFIVQCGAAVVLLAAAVFFPGKWNLWRWIGAFIAVPSTILFLIARYQLGRSFSASPQAKELITRGIYSKVSHPMYLFSGLLALAICLEIQLPFIFGVLPVLLVVQVVRAREEGRVLEAKFGEQYRAYRQHTWF